MFANYSPAQIALSLVMIILFIVQLFFFVKWVVSFWSDETCATWSVFGYLTIANYVQSFLYTIWRRMGIKPQHSQIQQPVYQAAKQIPHMIPNMAGKMIPAAAAKH